VSLAGVLRWLGIALAVASVWPWYSHVAPISWLVQRDVDEGRRKLNLSESVIPLPREGERAG
jgi:hypothetical protein